MRHSISLPKNLETQKMWYGRQSSNFYKYQDLNPGSFFFFFCHTWHMEVPGPGILAAVATYATALATVLGRGSSLCYCRECWIHNLLHYSRNSFLFLFFWLCLQHVEVPRPTIKPGPQQRQCRILKR